MSTYIAPIALSITDLRFQDCVDADPALCEVFSLYQEDEQRDTFGPEDFGDRVLFTHAKPDESETIILDMGVSTMRLQTENYNAVCAWLTCNRNRRPIGSPLIKP